MPALLATQSRLLKNNKLLAISAAKAFRDKGLPGADLTEVLKTLAAIDKLIQHPPANKLGMNCWRLSQGDAGVVMRWIYGGGNIGDIAEGVFAIPRGGAGRAWNLNWKLADALAAVGLKPLDCETYFTAVRAGYDKAAKLLQGSERELAQAAAQEAGSRHEYARQPLTTPPATNPWPWLIAGGIGVYLGGQWLKGRGALDL